MLNSERLSAIISKLEKEHINLYHEISKEEVQKYIANIKDINSMDKTQFDCTMLKIFALFNEAHTFYRVDKINLDKKIFFYDGKFYLVEDDKYSEILEFEGLSPKELFDKMVPLINYETKEYLNILINRDLNNGYIYKMLGLFKDDKLSIKLENNEKVIVKKDETIDKQNPKKILYYDSKILGDNIIYIRYKRCRQDPVYPFDKFVQDVKEQIDLSGSKNFICDLRDNPGGSSSIVNPLIYLLKEKNMKGVALMNNAVFSSGTFAIFDFKKKLNVTLIGDNAGEGIQAYGEFKMGEIDGCKFSWSTKFFDFNKAMAYADVEKVDVYINSIDGFDKNNIMYQEPFKPDIYVHNTIDDLKNNYDRQLDYAVSYVKNKTKSVDL